MWTGISCHAGWLTSRSRPHRPAKPDGGTCFTSGGNVPIPTATRGWRDDGTRRGAGWDRGCDGERSHGTNGSRHRRSGAGWRRRRRKLARRRRRPLHRPSARDRVARRRLRCASGRRRRGRPRCCPGTLPRPRSGRRHDAEHGRVRADPAPAAGSAHRDRLGDHAHRSWTLRRQAGGFRDRCRRLHRQALRHAGAARAYPGCAAPLARHPDAVTAHRTAGQRPHRGRDRGTARTRRSLRDPVRRPRPLQGLQRPLRVHARRRADPGVGTTDRRRRSKRR